MCVSVRKKILMHLFEPPTAAGSKCVKKYVKLMII
jgi:hypothetical protein